MRVHTYVMPTWPAGMCSYSCLAAAMLWHGVSGHFLWLREGSTSESAIVTFGERAGVPESAAVLAMVANATKVFWQTNMDDRVEVPITVTHLPGGVAELQSNSLLADPPYSLELSATFGVFAEGPEAPRLLKYWANADRVHVKEEWPLVEPWSGNEGLEILLLTPPMTSRQALENDQCSHSGAEQLNGSPVCVKGLVRYKKKAVPGVNITTFIHDGSKFGTAITDSSGFALLRYPLAATSSPPFTEVFASVNYHQQQSGEYGGKHYEFVDHWATAYARLPRASPSSAVLV